MITYTLTLSVYRFTVSDPPLSFWGERGERVGDIAHTREEKEKRMDSRNKFQVKAQGNRNQVVIWKLPVGALSEGDAINLAAWLLAVADPKLSNFKEIFELVKKTKEKGIS